MSQNRSGAAGKRGKGPDGTLDRPCPPSAGVHTHGVLGAGHLWKVAGHALAHVVEEHVGAKLREAICRHVTGRAVAKRHHRRCVRLTQPGGSHSEVACAPGAAVVGEEEGGLIVHEETRLRNVAAPLPKEGSVSLEDLPGEASR